MISTKRYTDTYNAWCDHLQKAAVNITKSSECRKYLIKNTSSDSWSDLLKAAVECIYSLTGDECFRKQVMAQIEEKKKTRSASAEWLATEFDEPLSGGGQLRVRGFKCSACGGFRHKRQGMSKFCEFCGAEMGGKDDAEGKNTRG